MLPAKRGRGLHYGASKARLESLRAVFSAGIKAEYIPLCLMTSSLIGNLAWLSRYSVTSYWNRTSGQLVSSN
jgi:hypothetical protein